MIKVEINGRYEYAKARYSRYEDADVITVTIETDTINVRHELSVPESEKLVKDLQDWIHEIKN